MPDDGRLVEIKDRAAAHLMAIPGVIGVGIGGRERAGRPTGELVIHVFVERKRPPAELSPGEMIPPAVEGVPTDVIQLGRLQLLGAPVPLPPPAPPTGKPRDPRLNGDDSRQRPLIGGLRFQVDLTGAGDGTLGCIVEHRNDPNKIYALTNWHVVGAVVNCVNGNLVSSPASVVGSTRVGQPRAEGSPTKCCSDFIGRYAGGALDSKRDAALVQLDPGTKYKKEIFAIGAVTGIHPLTLDDIRGLTYQVRKRGASTGLTGGTVVSINARFDDCGAQYPDTILVKPNPNPGQPAGTQLYFALEGDSGSALVNSATEVVGLVYGGATKPGDSPQGHGFANPITVVLNEFEAKDNIPLRVATATEPGTVFTVPGASVAALPPELVPALTGASVRGAAQAVRVPVRTPWLPGTAPPTVGTFTGLQEELDRSPAGQLLVQIWLEHHEELTELVDTNRRVTIAWNRGGGPALLQMLIRMRAEPTVALPDTLDGYPVAERLDRLHSAFARFASPPLRRDLDRARAALADPAGLTYPELIDSLGTR